MTFPALLEGLLAGTDLTRQDAAAVMSGLMEGAFEDAQIGALLVALRTKGAKPQELAGFAETMRKGALGLGQDFPKLIDTCGTGGGPSTFNLSTGAALVAAAAGAKVAKHGNRAVTSKCGSADVLESLGVCLTADREQLLKTLENVGIVFLFAPNHHPAMKHVGPARRSIGVRTVFNQLGPLSNPAGAKKQLIGVYDRSLVRPMADALVLLGTERAFVVHSSEGLDEISPCGQTVCAEVRGSSVLESTLSPEDFGLQWLDTKVLKAGATVEENAEILLEAITSADSNRANALLPNAAAALVLAGVVENFKQGAELARATIAEGKAAGTLEELVTWTS